MTPVFVTKAFTPPLDEFNEYLMQIWSSHVMTNNGPLVQKLEKEIRKIADSAHFLFLANGTLSLQLALKALDIDGGEVITTPFSYVATTSAALWERCTPVFADIEPGHFCIDPDKISPLITSRTRAIVATHVFGFACDVERIAKIAAAHKIPVIYDAAHAFGCRYLGKSLLSYGDIATCSFHATKIFHTVEGGGCVVQSAETAGRMDLLRRFGHNLNDHICLGINAKNSELHAAMGLCNLKYFAELVMKRKTISEYYDLKLPTNITKPEKQPGLEHNYGYYPVLFESESALESAFARLAALEIYPRRYFYPSLNTLDYLPSKMVCPVSEDISRRIACLPLYHDLPLETADIICNTLNG